MRSVQIRWVKLILFSVALISVSVIFTFYTTSCIAIHHVMDRGISKQALDGGLGQRFRQSELEFPDEEQPGSRTQVNEKNKIIMIRKPKGVDLNPVPVKMVGNVSFANLGLKEVPARRPPRCILLGFGKCGTSALLEFLDLHPQIVSLDWEPDYFCERMYPKYDLQWYVKRMPPSYANQIVIEKSPCYIIEHDSHLRIHAMNSSMQLMVIIRDPITRLLSEYGHYLATETYWGRPAISFKDRVFNSKTNQFRTDQILKVANYSLHFEHLLSVFPRNQVLIVDGDKLVVDPLSQTRLVENFLGLENKISSQDIYFDKEKGFYCMKVKATGESQCLGKSKGRQHVEVEPEFQRQLIEFLKPYNQHFFKVVGQSFDWLQ